MKFDNFVERGFVKRTADKPALSPIAVKVALTQILELSYEGAAKICQCRVGTIRSRVARARIDLIEALGTTGDGARRACGQGAAGGSLDAME